MQIALNTGNNAYNCRRSFSRTIIETLEQVFSVGGILPQLLGGLQAVECVLDERRIVVHNPIEVAVGIELVKKGVPVV